MSNKQISANLSSSNSNSSINSSNSSSSSKLNDYLNNLYDKVYNIGSPLSTKLIKFDNQAICIPKINEYKMLLKYNYTIQQLKNIVSYYKLKIVGNKSQMVSRIFAYLFLSNQIVKIQKFIRGMFVRKYNTLHGPGFKDKSICTNNTDFYTMDPLNELTNSQFFSFEDADGFIYGFDLLSIYNLIYKTEGVIKNPYNRLPISLKNIENLRALLRLSGILKIDICIKIKDINDEISVKKAIELRALSLFQNIDALGNYSNAEWFLKLEKPQLIKMVRELVDIWAYRAPLSMETKKAICPPLGNPFNKFFNYNQFQEIDNLDVIRKHCLDILENFVNSGADRANRCLGAYYVLGALTLVNADAATSLPWLYQAVCYM